MGGRVEVEKPLILLSNDDGVEAIGITALAQRLHDHGFHVVIFAPERNQSATSLALNLNRPLRFQKRDELLKNYSINNESLSLKIFSLDGTPADCMIVALDTALKEYVPNMVPSLMISGINDGPNMSIDVLHSGTFGAAREAALYGLPSVSVSIGEYRGSDFTAALDALTGLVEKVTPHLSKKPPNLHRPDRSMRRPWLNDQQILCKEGEIDESQRDDLLLSAFLNGDIVLNLNVPASWNGWYKETRLGSRWYRNATKFHQADGGESAYQIGASIVEDDATLSGDVDAVSAGYASLTPLPSWPQTHPLCVDDRLLVPSEKVGPNGIPSFLIVG